MQSYIVWDVGLAISSNSLPVCLKHSGVVSERLNVSSKFFFSRVVSSFQSSWKLRLELVVLQVLLHVLDLQ